jgi:hypothetical protein
MPSRAALLTSAVLVCTGVRAQVQAQAPPLRLVEQASQEGFPLERRFLDRRAPSLKAAGVYLRVRDGQKLYALCLYVDVRALAVLTQGKARDAEALARLLVEGKAAHAYVARIVEPFPRENRMAFLLGNLQRAWPSPGFDPEAPALKRFSRFFDRALAKGDETQVWLEPGGRIHTRQAGGPATATADAVIASTFSATYLGERSMDPALKADLLRELPAVVEMEEMLRARVRR